METLCVTRPRKGQSVVGCGAEGARMAPPGSGVPRLPRAGAPAIPRLGRCSPLGGQAPVVLLPTRLRPGPQTPEGCSGASLGTGGPWRACSHGRAASGGVPTAPRRPHLAKRAVGRGRGTPRAHDHPQWGAPRPPPSPPHVQCPRPCAPTAGALEGARALLPSPGPSSVLKGWLWGSSTDACDHPGPQDKPGWMGAAAGTAWSRPPALQSGATWE